MRKVIWDSQESDNKSLRLMLMLGLTALAAGLVIKSLENGGSMTTQQKRRIFLSFAYEDIAKVNGLRGLIQNPNHELEAYDESVREPINSQNSAYIKQRIRDKIIRSSVTVCLVSTTTHKSEWVHWELEESRRQGNTIVAMALKGITHAKVPRLLQQWHITVYLWDPSFLDRLIETAR